MRRQESSSRLELPRRQSRKVFTTPKTIATFKCRICNGDFKGFMSGEGDDDGNRAMVLKEFCSVLDFDEKPIPDECPRDAIYFCVSCEMDVRSVVKSPETLKETLTQLFSKVTVATLPPTPTPGEDAKPDWLTDLTILMMKFGINPNSVQDENENVQPIKKEPGTSGTKTRSTRKKNRKRQT